MSFLTIIEKITAAIVLLKYDRLLILFILSLVKKKVFVLQLYAWVLWFRSNGVGLNDLYNGLGIWV